MTTLERYLVKKQVPKSSEESKQEEVQKLGPKTELVSTLSYLKGIFVNESDHDLTLLALQHPDPRDLEEVVQRILESGKALQEFKDAWNTVKSRDKKKPDPRKDYKKKRFHNRVEEENEAIPGYNAGRKRNQNRKNEERRPETYTRAPRQELKSEAQELCSNVTQRSETSLAQIENSAHDEKFRTEVEDSSKSYEETKKASEDPHHSANDLKPASPPASSVPSAPVAHQVHPVHPVHPAPQPTPPQDFPSLVSSKDWPQTPPQVINTNKYPNPPSVIEEEKENKLPAEMSEKILSPASSAHPWPQYRQRPETRDFGVQVEMEYGIPIVVYPYMFRKA